MAFDSLTEKLQNVFKNLRSKGVKKPGDLSIIIFIRASVKKFVFTKSYDGRVIFDTHIRIFEAAAL